MYGSYLWSITHDEISLILQYQIIDASVAF